MTGVPRSPEVRRDCSHVRTHHEHGTNLAFVRDKCRCAECRAAAAKYQAARMRRRAYGLPDPLVPAVGSIRRLQALQTLGWAVHRLEAMEAAAGLPPVRLQPNTRAQFVTRAKAARIERLYDALWDKPAPVRTTGERKSVTYALGQSRRNGYSPPLAWDDETIDDPAAEPAVTLLAGNSALLDEVAVERAMAGDRVPLTKAERLEATRRLTAMGMPTSEIARRLRVDERTVARRRAADRKAA